ncbi:Protein ABHD11 like protein [Argiope bruennichi]|uniref:sn-1-specific diacylglycerol lipase ABHD11 n=1 Tax=Argiope bruennichi TaxID=94029 RepID=A0A8T0FVX7_ARGBR|nr:Protein ABHD11 like protein [Argiope bruennichi]
METIELAYDVYEYNDTRQDLPPIILLHGMTWSKYMYREVCSKLCQKTKRKVYCLDLRNHGESPFSEKMDIFVMTEDVKRFLTEHDCKRVTFVAHSFSCTISYLIAIHQPEIVEKMVMVDSFPFNDFYEDMKGNFVPEIQAQNRVLKALNPKMSLKDARTKLNKLAQMGPKAKELFYKKLAHDLMKEDGKFKWKVNIDFIHKAILAEFPGFSDKREGFCTHEILFVRCSNSYNIPDSRFEKILKYCPNSKLITIEDTTHLVLLEKVDEFVDVVHDFLTPV